MAPLPPGAGSFQATMTSVQATSSSTSETPLRAAAVSSLSSTTTKPVYSRSGIIFDSKQTSVPVIESKQYTWSATPTKQTQRQKRSARSTPAASTPAPYVAPQQQQQQQQQQQSAVRPIVPAPIPPIQYPPPSHVSRPPLPTTPQAFVTTYASRLRTGATLLMQPILASTSNAGNNVGRTGTRRGGVINYAEVDSGDDEKELDAGERERDSEDSDFVASGGLRSSLRATRMKTGINSYQYSYTSGSPAPQSVAQGKAELDQSYLGLIPPSRFITAKRAEATKHSYPSQEALDNQALKPSALVPVRVEFETETHRIRDCFMWDLNDDLVKPELFARIFCTDLDLPQNPWVETIANQIRAQLEEYEGIATMDLGSSATGYEEVDDEDSMDVEVPECRVILSIDVQIATHHLMDHIEWDLLSPLTPEAFAIQLCADIGLTGEAVPLIAHALHEEILKHKKDAIEWGVIGGDTSKDLQGDGERDRERSVLKDKTGLGLGPGIWGRPPRDGLGRGPRALKSIWKDWNDAEEYATRFEILTAEEVERREIERERASRRLRRETSKFQSSARRRR